MGLGKSELEFFFKVTDSILYTGIYALNRVFG